jgi:hypothetical protein
MLIFGNFPRRSSDIGVPSFDEAVNDRYKIRFSFGEGSQSPLSRGYSIKFTLIDEQNLLLYQNIVELSYSSVRRAIKGKNVRPGSNAREREVAPAEPIWDEKTLRHLSRNFVDEACKVMGEDYRRQVGKAMKQLISKLNQLHPPS